MTSSGYWIGLVILSHLPKIISGGATIQSWEASAYSLCLNPLPHICMSANPVCFYLQTVLQTQLPATPTATTLGQDYCDSLPTSPTDFILAPQPHLFSK